MASRVVVQEGYTLPFASYSRKPRRKSAPKRRLGALPAALRVQANKMSACAKEWRSGDARASTYKAHIKKCLKD